MSMGYGASCILIDRDDECYIYSYTSYNLDLPNWEEAKNTFDGSIVIDKEFFSEPEIIRKRKRKPNGKKYDRKEKVP